MMTTNLLTSALSLAGVVVFGLGALTPAQAEAARVDLTNHEMGPMGPANSDTYRDLHEAQSNNLVKLYGADVILPLPPPWPPCIPEASTANCLDQHRSGVVRGLNPLFADDGRAAFTSADTLTIEIGSHDSSYSASVALYTVGTNGLTTRASSGLLTVSSANGVTSVSVSPAAIFGATSRNVETWLIFTDQGQMPTTDLNGLTSAQMLEEVIELEVLGAVRSFPFKVWWQATP